MTNKKNIIKFTIEEGNTYNHLEEEDRKLFFERKDFSIYELYRKYTRGDIDLNPDYQRNEIWTDPKKSKLIESVLINIPIPFIYLVETEKNKKTILEVVDGKQRLLSFFKFMNNEYSLKKLEVLDDFNSFKFENLPSGFQRKLEDYQLYVFIIKKETHKDVKFDIFQRINEGAVKLNTQELRNSIYNGSKITKLKKFSDIKIFQKVISSHFPKRLKDQELMLRFLAFYKNGYENYNGNINSFLNNTLEAFDDFNEVKYINLIEKTMSMIKIVFIENFFVKSQDGIKRFNISLFDIITYSFAKISNKEKIIEKKEMIYDLLYNKLLKNDNDFIKSVTDNTLSINSVNYRFKKWIDELSKILEEDIEND